MTTDDDLPADFEWLASQCERTNGEDWVVWENGCVSFTVGEVWHDHGEVETVATDWQVEGEHLPQALVPTTRGDFRRLCELANR